MDDSTQPELLLMFMLREWRLSNLMDSNQLLRSCLWLPVYLVHIFHPSFPYESEGFQQCYCFIHLTAVSSQFHYVACSQEIPAFEDSLDFSFQGPMDAMLHSDSIPNVLLDFHEYCSFRPGYESDCLMFFFLHLLRYSANFAMHQDPLTSVNCSLGVGSHSSHGLRHFVSNLDFHYAMKH